MLPPIRITSFCPMFVRSALFALASLLAWGTGSTAYGSQPPSNEEQRREAHFMAAYLAHLLRFSTWDEADLPPEGKTVGLAVIGDDNHQFAQALLFLIDELDITLQGRSIKVFSLARIPDADEEEEIFKGCAVVYFLESENERWSECTLCEKKGVLAVGEGAKYAQEGACVSFVRSRNRIRLLVNREGYSSRNLKISSKLFKLRSAVEVFQKEG